MKKIISMFLILSMFLSLNAVSFASTNDGSVKLKTKQAQKIYSDFSNVSEVEIENAINKIDLKKQGLQEVSINEDFILVHELKQISAQENTRSYNSLSKSEAGKDWGKRSITIKSTTWPHPKLYTLNISALFVYDGKTKCDVKTVNANVETHLWGLDGRTYNIRNWTTEENGKTWGIASAQYDITFGITIGHIVKGKTVNEILEVHCSPEGKVF